MTPSKSLWSLWEMLEFKAEVFTHYMKVMGDLRCLANQYEHLSSETRVKNLNLTENILSELRELCSTRNLRMTSMAAEQQIKHINGFKEISNNPTVGPEIASGLEAVQYRLKDELSLQFLLSLTSKEAEWFSSTTPRFGAGVEDKFPATIEDIDESAKCLGLGRYTASVFHLMRVMERGVQKFGDKLNVSLINAMGKEKNWQNLLDEANKTIKTLAEKKPPDPLASQYANISSNLYNVKLAWRNEVMHPKDTYTPDEAEAVFFAVRGFMRELASVI